MQFFIFRYKGKQSPDAILAEVCWRAKNMFEDDEYDKRMHMEVESERMEVEGGPSQEGQDERFEFYADSDSSGDDTDVDMSDDDDSGPPPPKMRK